MSECQTLPTRTISVEHTGHETLTTSVETTTTAPDATITSTQTSVLCETTNSTSVCETLFFTSTITSEGETITHFVTELTTVPTTSWETQTLYTTTCAPGETPPDPDPDTSIPPPPSDTLPGDVSSTPFPSSTPGSSTGTSSSTSHSSSGSPTPTGLIDDAKEDGVNVGAIAGGVVGGFFGLLAIVLIGWFIIKKSGSRFDRYFHKDIDEDLQEIGHHEKGRTSGHNYHYNLVGQAPSSSGSGGKQMFHHQEPGYQVGGYQDTSYQPHTGLDQFVNNTAYQPNEIHNTYPPEGHGHHARTPSFTPLLAGAGAAAAAGGAVYATGTSRMSTYTDRPSTAGSMQPLVQHNQGTHPGYPGPVPPQGYSYPPPQSNLSHNLSTGSAVTATSAGGLSYASFNNVNQQPPPPMPPLSGMLVPGGRQAESSSGRSGSPVSFQNHTRLQVVNPEGLTYGADPASGSGSGSGSSAAQQQQQQEEQVPQYDGKGRPVNLRGEKAPIVHLDGGRYEEPDAPVVEATVQQPAPSGSAPPAYS